MGSGESTTRKVSFGVDDEDRVRILRGVKLSEDVLQRMRGVANIAPEHSSPTSVPNKDTGLSSKTQQKTPGQPSTQSNTSKPASSSKEEQKRYERQQNKLKEELAKVAEREKEAAREEMTRARNRERLNTQQEVERVKQLSADEVEVMAQQLQKKDSQLKALDAFYREQLAQLQNKNWERYEESKEKFHQAASETEGNVRPQNTEPVCSHLQAQILTCYKDNKGETLRCSDLAKEYMRCIHEAKKNLLVTHG